MGTLNLELSGTKLEMEIKDYEKHEWCSCTFHVHSDFISYDLVDDETLEAADIDYLMKQLKKLLAGELTEQEEISFTEPFLEFILWPSSEDYEASVDWKFILWEDPNQVFTGNYFSLQLGEDDIRKLVGYLEEVMKGV